MSLWAACLSTLTLATLVIGSTAQEACGNRPGTCVQISQCPAFVDLLKVKPVPSNTAAFLRQSQCGFKGNQPMVCCPPDPPLASESRLNAPNPLLPNQTECGEIILSRIIGGQVADLTDFPWMALLEYTKPNGKGFHCGGSLISAQYVLTAAHCIRTRENSPNVYLTSVRLGEWDTSADEDCVTKGGVQTCNDPPIDIPVEGVTVHENYVDGISGQQNDIALVRLSKPVVFTEYINPICLPILNEKISKKKYVGNRLTVAGWGKTENETSSTKKLKVDVPVIEQADCTQFYEELGVSIDESQLCAGGELDKDSCRGDSGGPLMVTDTQGKLNNWYLTGISSFGSTPCAQENVPAVYTRVASFNTWISNNVKP